LYLANIGVLALKPHPLGTALVHLVYPLGGKVALPSSGSPRYLHNAITMDAAASTNAEEQAAQKSALDRHGYLFGQKIAASMSPQFHQAIFDELGWQWEQLRLDSADIPGFLELLQDPKCFGALRTTQMRLCTYELTTILGASVTMPNKIAIMEHLDEISPECREVGACNTIFFRDEEDAASSEETATTTTDGHRRRRRLHGTNTDVIGVRDSFYQNVSNLDIVFHSKPAMVIGGGGAARSAVYALWKWMRASTIYLVNRDPLEVAALIRDCSYVPSLVHVASVEEAERLETPGAIVACVPDFSPMTPAEKTVRAVVETFLKKEGKGAMLEMCYNPTPYTELYRIAVREGWQVILGTEAMIWQGFEQVCLLSAVSLTNSPRFR